MYCIGELLNGSNRRIGAALEREDWSSLVACAAAQKAAGARALDINVGTVGPREPELLAELAARAGEVTGLPLWLDSARRDVLTAAARRCPVRALTLNSAVLDRDSLLPLAHLAGELDASLVVLAMRGSLPVEAGEAMARELDALQAALREVGLPQGRVTVDPVVLPLAYYPEEVGSLLQRLQQIRSAGFAAVCGLSNVSFGMPRRRALHRALLPLLMDRGLEQVILDPTDRVLMELASASEALLSEGEGVMAYLRSMRGR